MDPLKELTAPKRRQTKGLRRRLKLGALEFGKILRNLHGGALFHDKHHGIISSLNYSCNFKTVNNLSAFSGFPSW